MGTARAADSFGGQRAGQAGAGLRTDPVPSLFTTLEERIVELVERYQKAQKRIEELESAVAERDRRVALLGEKADTAEKLRVGLADRVARLIDDVSELEADERRLIEERES